MKKSSRLNYSTLKPIKIKKANRGKFTAYAKGRGQSVQQAAQSVLKNPKASPTLKKRANFARNFGGRR